MFLRHSNAVVSVGVLVGLFVSCLFADHHRESAPHRCLGCATGQCQAGSPHGYWKPSWRRWPGATTYRGFRQPAPQLDVPTSEIPNQFDEIRVEPRRRPPVVGPDAGGLDSGALDDGGMTTPLIPEMTDGNLIDTTESNPFSTRPETQLPNDIPIPFDPGPLDDTPVPPNNLFEDLDLLPGDSPETNPDENLFDNLQSRVPVQDGRKISQRAIKTRRLGSAIAASNVHGGFSSVMPVAGNQLTDLVAPTIDVDLHQDPDLAPTTGREQPLLLETPLMPIEPLSTGSARPGSEPISPVSHVEEMTPNVREETAAATPTSWANVANNPLRASADTDVTTSSNEQGTRLEKNGQSVSEPTTQKRLRASRRGNPLRQ